ncbi:MAG: glycerate kinase type-2 family protein [Methylomonas sp.]
MPYPTEILRRHALEFFQAGVAAANPYQAVKNALLADGRSLKLCIDSASTGRYRIGDWPQIHLIAFGKAACAMAAAAQESIPANRLAGRGIAVTTYDNVTDVENVEVIGAGHPLPDAAGLAAAKIVAERAQGARSGELVLVLVSGGGSALLPAPADAINLQDKIIATDLLLASGATINQVNCVRKHLSKLKGGGLAKLSAPADLHALILSDVLGDDLSAIASGPTVADDTTFGDAIAILESYNILAKIPASILNYLQQGAQGQQLETPKTGDEIFKSSSYALIGSNALSVDAVVNVARRHYCIDLYSNQLCGEARTAAEKLVHCARKLIDNGLESPMAIIAGGETTVTLSGTGKGGRNQEMALAFALAAEQANLAAAWTFLSGGTDGRDGPTDAAGGIVDAGTLQRIRQAGLDPLASLDNNDAYPALKAANDLLMTGATGTNVADLQILLLHAAS